MSRAAFDASINHIMGCLHCYPQHNRMCATGTRLYARLQRRQLTAMVIAKAQESAGRREITLDDCRKPLRDPLFQEMLGPHRPVVMRMVRYCFHLGRKA